MNKRVRQEWARLIKAKRAKAGYATQQALAEAMGVSQGSVSSWEHGTWAPRPHHWPRLRTLLGIADNEMERIYQAMQEAA